MDGLSLHFLGQPTVDVDGRPLEVDTRKAIALLAYLTLEGPQSRESLAALLWPDSDTRRARAALRRTLSVLNRGLSGRWLDAGRNQVGLAGDDWRADAMLFRERLDRTRGHGHPPEQVCPECLLTLEAAAALHRGDFLEGFSLRDSAAFDEWAIVQAEHLRRELTGVLERIVRSHALAGHFEQAIIHARRHVELDPLQEPAHRRLMQLYAWTDRRADAVRQYRECVAVLDRELGVQPLDETSELHKAIIEDRAPSPPAPPIPPADPRPVPQRNDTAQDAAPARRIAAGSPGGRGSHLPLIGRDEILEAIVAGHAAIEGSGRLLSVTGEGGVGKTRLFDEALGRIGVAGARVIAVRCHPGDRRLAYTPVAEALRAALALPGTNEQLARIAPHWRAEAARLVPDLAGSADVAMDPLTSPGARARFVEGVCRVLVAVVDGPVAGAIAFDDLHHADDATIDVLLYLVSRLDTHPIALLAAWRDEELPVNDAWRQAVAEANLTDDGRHFRLQRLDVDDVQELLQVSAVEAVPGFAQRLHAETEGLPLAVVAYLQEMDAEAVAAGQWPLPAGLHHLFRSRIAALDETAMQLLAAAAVIGRSFDFDTVMSASGRADTEVVDALETLVDRGMIRELGTSSPDVTFDFTHEKLRSVVYENTSLARRRLLHRRVAEALRTRLHQRGENFGLAGRIAHHEMQAGREHEAARMHALAGEQARSLYANREALEHLEQALALGYDEAAVLHEAIGDLLTLDGDYRRALGAYDTATAATSEPRALSQLSRKAGVVQLRAGDGAGALARFEAALEELGEEDAHDLLAQIHADRSLAEVRLDRASEAEASAHRSLEHAQRAGDERVIAQAHNILGMLARRAGHLDEALKQLEASAALADRLADPQARIAAHNNLALALAAADRSVHAIEHAQTAIAICARIGDRHRQAALHSNMADLLHAAARDEEAMEHLKQSAMLFAEVGGEADRQPEIWKLTDW